MTTVHIIAAFMGGGLVGFFACAAMTAGKLKDAQDWDRAAEQWAQRALDERADRDRSSDLAGTLQGKITDIRDLIDESRTIRKADIRAVLGDA